MSFTRRATLTLLGATLIAASAGTAKAGDWPKQLRYAIVPAEGDGVQAAYARLFKHLEAQLGVPVVPYKVNDVTAVIVALTNGQVESARIGGESYVIARRQGNVDAIATEETAQGTGYYGGLWVRADSGISSIEQAKGKRLAFNDPSSTSGYLVPMIHFMDEMKVHPKTYFSQVTFAGGATPAVLALVNKQVDVAAVSFPYAELAVTQGLIKSGEIIPLWTSRLIPNPAYVVRRDLPEDFRKAYQRALTTFDDSEGLAGLPGGVKRIVPAKDSDYDFVRDLGRIKQELEASAKQ